MNSEKVKKAIDRMFNDRKEHLDRLAAAFVKEVGSTKASEYVLVEHQDIDDRKITTRWKFVHKSKVPAPLGDL